MSGLCGVTVAVVMRRGWSPAGACSRTLGGAVSAGRSAVINSAAPTCPALDCPDPGSNRECYEMRAVRLARSVGANSRRSRPPIRMVPPVGLGQPLGE